jgi:hypothetical protein
MGENRGLYEVLSGYPKKMYFDVDKKHDNDSESLTPDEFLNQTKEHIRSVFPDAQMAVSGSYTETKWSLHLILSNYQIANEGELEVAKRIVKRMYDTMDQAFDWKVYTKNRNMKCVNQSKRDGRVQVLLENEDLKAHCIMCFFDPGIMSISTLPGAVDQVPATVPGVSRASRSSNGLLDLAMLPPLDTGVLNNVDGLCVEDLTARQVLELIPLNEQFDFKYTTMVGRFCYSNELSFETYVSWLKRKHADVERSHSKYRIRWDNHFPRFPSVTIEMMHPILKLYYPVLFEDKPLKQLVNLFRLDKCGVEQISISRLTQEMFNIDRKFLLFNLGMGCGKTVQTIQYLRRIQNRPVALGESVSDSLDSTSTSIWIAPNRALSHNTKQRLSSNGVECCHYSLDIKPEAKKNGELNGKSHVICVTNSLFYLAANKTYDIVIIDEIETVLELFVGDFMQKKSVIWGRFKHIIRCAKRVILLDAFITTKTIELMCGIDPISSAVVFNDTNTAIRRNVVYIEKFEQAYMQLVRLISDGQKVFIFYPFKHGTKNLPSMADLCTKLSLDTNTCGKFYNADVDDTHKLGLRDVDNAWSACRFIVTNQVITCGVNYEVEDIDCCFLFCSSFCIPRTIIQVSYRPRYLKSNTLYMTFVGGKVANSSYTNADEVNCNLFTSLIANVMAERHSPQKEAFAYFCDKAHYSQVPDESIVHSATTALFGTSEMVWTFDSLELLTDNEISGPDVIFGGFNYIQRKTIEGIATQREKLLMQKFYFVSSYCVGCDEFELEGVPILEYAWDNRLLQLFHRLIQICRNSNHFIYQMLNDMGGVFNPFMLKLGTSAPFLSNATIALLFNKFSFRYLSRESSHRLIAREVFNSFFGMEVVKTERDKGRHTSRFSIDPKFGRMYEFHKQFLYGYVGNGETNRIARLVVEGLVDEFCNNLAF